MQQAESLYRDGKLTEAIESLQAFLREHPSEKRARNFLFELLCFTGEFERARKQLSILADGSNENRLGTTFYLAAVAGEVERQAYYLNPVAPEAADSSPPPVAEEDLSGVCNGKPFIGIRDIDSRLGASLEFLASGAYHRMAFRNLKRVEVKPPKNVRDLYWLSANAVTTEALGSVELESILLPVLYPQTFLFDDDLTRLGRTTDWAQTETGTEIPCGQRMLLVGVEEIPLLAIRCIEFDPIAEPGKPHNG